MSTLWKKLTAIVPEPFLITLLLGSGFMGFVAWDQSHWWRIKEDYGFGWLVPAFVAFVVHDRWPRIVEALQACAAPGSARTSGGLLKLLMYSSLTAGMVLFTLGALYRAGPGSSFPSTFALSLGMGAILLPLLVMNAPEPAGTPTTGGWAADERIKLAGLFVFPVLVWLVSAPMISVIESNLSLFMLKRVTSVVFLVFETLGMPIEQHDNVLVLPTGSVGVADACSGIRSFTACLFAGSFLAAVFLDKFWKKAGLVLSAIGFAFFTNILRSLFLTAWAYEYGPDAIEGTVHDAAGYAVLGLTVVGLLCLLPLFNLKFSSLDGADAGGDEEPKGA